MKKKEFFLILGGISLLVGMWQGLARIGWNLAMPQLNWMAIHGIIMVNGFFGTLIGLERAVALNKTWGYLCPLLAGIGSILLIFELSIGIYLLFLSSVLFLSMNVNFLKQQMLDFVVGGAIGALAWVVSNLILMLTSRASDSVFLWICFFVLTISAERLGLSRFTNRPEWAKYAFWIPNLLIVISGIIPKSLAPPFLGIGLIGIALWLIKFDIVRKNLYQKGLTKFTAVGLILGYIWLIVGGIFALIFPINFAGPFYDALIHSIMIGFVFSMVFAHAPIILPSVLGIKRTFKTILYLPLWLLHSTLALRIAADSFLIYDLRLIGGLGNTISILLFILLFAIITIKQKK